MNVTPREPKPLDLTAADWQTIYLALVDAWNAGFGFIADSQLKHPRSAKHRRLRELTRERMAPYGAMIDRLFPD